MDLASALACKDRGFDKSGLDTRPEHLPMPSAMIVIDDLARILAFENALDTLAHGLETKMIAPRGHRIALLAIRPHLHRDSGSRCAPARSGLV